MEKSVVKSKFVMKKSYSGAEYFLEDIVGELPKMVSITKVLGGKRLVGRSRWWTHHGGGGWITEYHVLTTNIDKVKKSLESFGIESEWLNGGEK